MFTLIDYLVVLTALACIVLINWYFLFSGSGSMLSLTWSPSVSELHGSVPSTHAS